MGLVKKLLILVGPTAAGKTELSLVLGELLHGEIVSADSRLFYRGMDIGTAKPTLTDFQRVPHHLINVCPPDRTLTLGEYQQLAYSKIDQVIERNNLPLLVGGTGQYVMAVAEGWGIPRVAPNPLLRDQLLALGRAEMNRWLEYLDPAAAEKIDSRNERRVIRALEVALISGYPITELQRKSPPDYDMVWIGLYREREILYQRIDQRVDEMIANGLVDEVNGLRQQGFNRNLPSMSGLGYRQIYAYLEGESTLDEAVQRIKFETHRFARQQSTWFRKNDRRINWFDLDQIDVTKAIIQFAQEWLAN